MVKILAIDPMLSANDAPFAPRGLDSTTHTALRLVKSAPQSFVSAHDWALADIAVLAAGQSAERDGFNALCVLGFGDYGVNALRSVLSIPVVGAARSAMLHALTLGSRFSIVAPADHGARGKKLVIEYGLTRQCASVRGFATDSAAGAESFARLRDVAQACIAEDGADVLCLALSGAQGLSERLSDALGAPVVDPSSLACKLAESFIGLRLTHSRRAYPEPMTRKPELIDALVAASAMESR